MLEALWQQHSQLVIAFNSLSVVIVLWLLSTLRLQSDPSTDDSDTAKIFMVGCLKLIAIARIYESLCRLSRFGSKWILPSGVCTLLALPLTVVCSFRSNQYCQPTELIAYFILLNDFGGLFKFTANFYRAKQLDVQVLFNQGLSLAAGYFMKSFLFMVGFYFAGPAAFSIDLSLVFAQLGLMFLISACLHLVVYPMYLLHLLQMHQKEHLILSNSRLLSMETTEDGYYSSFKKEIKVLMIAGLISLHALGQSSNQYQNYHSQTFDWIQKLSIFTRWDSLLVTPYAVFLLIFYWRSRLSSLVVQLVHCSSQTEIIQSVMTTQTAQFQNSHSNLLTVPGHRKRLLSSQMSSEKRSLETLLTVLANKESWNTLSDDDILILLKNGHVKSRQLESITACPNRAVLLRRQYISWKLNGCVHLGNIPHDNYDFKLVHGRCCEEVIGLSTLPLGIAGPLIVNGIERYIPLATTEGCLVASINRGCSLIRQSGGCQAVLFKDGMTRAPVLAFPSSVQAVDCMNYLQSNDGFIAVSSCFEATSSHCKLTNIQCFLAGRNLHIRFCASTGEAMGMNMLSKGSEEAVVHILSRYKTARLISLSGNTCTDKKASGINWILGRGKSVVCEARISEECLKSVMHVSVSQLLEINRIKNLEGSAIAASLGGNNAHAANIAAALFIACGQDPAQVTEASQCLLSMEPDVDGHVYVAVTMPCVEVGVIGGGSHLPTQKTCLRLVGALGYSDTPPAVNLAYSLAASVLCAELSLLAALCNQELVSSHMKLNRSKQSHQPIS